MMELSPGTKERLRALFAERDVAEAERLLAHDRDGLPDAHAREPAGLERIRFAAIRASGGRLDDLRSAIELARVDFRDLLVNAGFGLDAHAHEQWVPRRLDAQASKAWSDGVGLEGVTFLSRDRVEVVTGEARMQRGVVLALLRLEPEPRYGIGLESGRRIEAEQRWLQRAR